MVRADCFFGLFSGFEILRRSRSEFFGAKTVRTNSRILHQIGKVKEFWFASLPACRQAGSEANLQNLQFPQWCPREESNPYYEIRNLVSYPLNDEGAAFNLLKPK